MPDTTQDVEPGREEPASTAEDAADISPSVRRLLRQYDVDISTIQGTGPQGRIRPGDVLAIVGNPQLTRTPRADDAAPKSDEEEGEMAAEVPRVRAKTVAPSPLAIDPAATTIFVCNMSRVLAHRKRTAAPEISIACYAAKAAGLAAGRLHHLKDERDKLPIRVRLTTAEGESAAVLDDAGTNRVETIHRALAGEPGAAPGTGQPRLSVQHHGLPGSIVDLLPPLDDGEAAVLSIGGLQRTIGITTTDSGETPRILVESRLALTYRPHVLSAGQAARFVAECVRILETWPLPDTGTQPELASPTDEHTLGDAREDSLS